MKGYKHPFLNGDIFYERLENYYKTEKEKLRKIIVACDFDDTLYDCRNKGYDLSELITLIKKIRPYVYLIIFTARPQEEYTIVENYLKEKEITYDTINEEAPWMQNKYCRKVYYHILLDDKAGLETAYQSLAKLLEKIESGEIDE